MILNFQKFWGGGGGGGARVPPEHPPATGLTYDAFDYNVSSLMRKKRFNKEKYQVRTGPGFTSPRLTIPRFTSPFPRQVEWRSNVIDTIVGLRSLLLRRRVKTMQLPCHGSALLCLRGSRGPRRVKLDLSDADLDIKKGLANIH